MDTCLYSDDKTLEASLKKKRTMFSGDQKDMLEYQFLNNPYPDKTQRKKLADDLGVKDKSIDYWFGHRRAKQAKLKRTGSSDSDVPSQPAVSGPSHSSFVSKDLHFDNHKMHHSVPLTVTLPSEPLFFCAPSLSDYDDCHDILFKRHEYNPWQETPHSVSSDSSSDMDDLFSPSSDSASTSSPLFYDSDSRMYSEFSL
eukprot:TRINITY_DN13982_c0_g1_i1.p1 TRINITY_DN13982_c0_g1~~TRINITY_DN13982_c0_g1_i1.p1  ORF type:complete len:198 (-),score=14.89 TRINITY_DN13982_c0_g1_i1:14-607(-)